MTAADRRIPVKYNSPQRESSFSRKKPHYYVHTRFLILLIVKNKHSVFVYSALQQRS